MTKVGNLVNDDRLAGEQYLFRNIDADNTYKKILYVSPNAGASIRFGEQPKNIFGNFCLNTFCGGMCKQCLA
ncbi:MAG: hypothetical protein ACKODM_01280 [Cytophagales bacterium]